MLYSYVFVCLFGIVVGAHRHARQAIVFGQAASASTGCTTPDGKVGSCVKLQTCAPLYDRLRGGERGTEFISFLRKSVCRYQNNVPIVCCAENEPEITTVTPVDTPSVTTPTTTTSTTPTPSVNITSVQLVSPTNTSTAPVTTPTPPPTAAPAGLDLLPKDCGISDRTSVRIVGGRISDQGAWPWLAALGYRNFRGRLEFLCGGALITAIKVLTAAHCVDRRTDLEVIRMGEHDIDIPDDTDHVDFNISSVLMHDQYDDQTFDNDIAIITLATPVKFNAIMSAVCLPLHSFYQDNTLAGRQAFVAGWGSIAYNNISSPILKEAQLPIRTNEDCEEGYSVFRSIRIDKRRLCAGVGTDDACQGDSGGPLMVYNSATKTYSVVGVVSVGFRCAEEEFPGIYTRVTEFRDWIGNNL